jgi:hypothetical protein
MGDKCSVSFLKTVNFEHPINIVDYPDDRGFNTSPHIAMLFLLIQLPAMEWNPASRQYFS